MDEQILEVARSIRPYLPQLIGDAAAQCDRRLVELLNHAASGADVGPDILDLLMRQPVTHTWAAAMLADEEHLPPNVRAACASTVHRGWSATRSL